MSTKTKYLKLKDQREKLLKSKKDYNFPEKRSNSIEIFNKNINAYLSTQFKSVIPSSYTTSFSELTFKVFNPEESTETPIFTIEFSYSPDPSKPTLPFNIFKFITPSNKFVNEKDLLNLTVIGNLSKIFIKKQKLILSKISKEYEKIKKAFQEYTLFLNKLNPKFIKIERQMALLVSNKICNILTSKETFYVKIEEIKYYGYRISTDPFIMYPSHIRLKSFEKNLYEIEIGAPDNLDKNNTKYYTFKTINLKEWVEKYVVNKYFPLLEYVILNPI